MIIAYQKTFDTPPDAAEAIDADPVLPLNVKLLLCSLVAHLDVQPRDHVVAVGCQGNFGTREISVAASARYIEPRDAPKESRAQ